MNTTLLTSFLTKTRIWTGLLALVSMSTLSVPAFAETARIAVAANFTKTIELLANDFSKQSGHRLKFSFGPTGKLYAQIRNGAPFDAFFSADELRAKKVIEDGLGIESSYFVYAQGQIALYSAKHPVASQPLEVLRQANFRHLAVANPKTAPYGERALEVLKKYGLESGLQKKLVFGESVGNAFQYVATGNAEIGFIALSQLVDPQSPLFKKGEYWTVPQHDYQPINQGAVILKRGQNNAAVAEFMAYLKTPAAQTKLQQYGYSLPSPLQVLP